MNVESLTVVQAVVADGTLSALPFGQFPLSPSRKKPRFLGLSLLLVGAQCRIIRRRIMSNHDMAFDRPP